jgi:hypothetical protein
MALNSSLMLCSTVARITSVDARMSRVNVTSPGTTFTELLNTPVDASAPSFVAILCDCKIILRHFILGLAGPVGLAVHMGLAGHSGSFIVELLFSTLIVSRCLVEDSFGDRSILVIVPSSV